MKTLREIPAIRALAEEQARDFYAAHARRNPFTALAGHGWGDLLSTARDLLVSSFLDILCDLGRPASRDAIARLIAEAIGMECGATAPALWRTAPWLWAFASMRDSAVETPNDGAWFTVRGPSSGRVRALPALDGVTDPAEALRLIAIAVLGGSRG